MSVIAKCSTVSNTRPATRKFGATRSAAGSTSRSGIDDDEGRVGHYPGRLEAEDAQLDGYTVIDVTPWEAASNSKAAALPAGTDSGSITFTYNGEPMTADLRVQYFDEEDGISQFKLFVGNQELDHWQADNHLPTFSKLPDAHTSIRHTIRNVDLHPGDQIHLEATADSGERRGRRLHRDCSREEIAAHIHSSPSGRIQHSSLSLWERLDEGFCLAFVRHQPAQNRET